MKNDELIKAVKPQIGDTKVDKNGVTLIYKQTKSGKLEWRVKKDSDNTPPPSAKTTPSKPSDAQKFKASAKSGKIDVQRLTQQAADADDDTLLNYVNRTTMNTTTRKIAYDELKKRGFDMSKVDTSGGLDQLLKMTAKTPSTNGNNKIAPAASGAKVDIDDDADEGGDIDGFIEEKWYLNKNDERVVKKFNGLKTKLDRIKYDQFVYKKKKEDPDYKKPTEVIQELNENYLEFLNNDKQRFMISAGGAGIGKSYGFDKLAELLNKRPFQEGDAPGDNDYDTFEATDVKSAKQLLNILKSHNGKIIVFDDTDSVLTRSDCASIMKKATAPTGKRIVGDPDDVKTNFEFTGRIVIMTNKSLTSLATQKDENKSEDIKAIISRATMLSDIYMTVPETIQLMEERYQDYEFPSLPRLNDAKADMKERDEVLNFIKSNEKSIDPAVFTTRTFQEILTAKRKTESANELRKNAAFSQLIGSKSKDWKKVALDALTKASVDELNEDDNQDDFVKAEVHSLRKGYSAEDDGVDYTIDDPEMTLEKAEEIILDDWEMDVFKAEEDEEMTVEAAEQILFG